MTFGEKVKAVRLQLLLSQREFAKELGATHAALNRWETGIAKPNYKYQRVFKEYCERNNIKVDES